MKGLPNRFDCTGDHPVGPCGCFVSFNPATGQFYYENTLLDSARLLTWRNLPEISWHPDSFGDLLDWLFEKGFWGYPNPFSFEDFVKASKARLQMTKNRDTRVAIVQRKSGDDGWLRMVLAAYPVSLRSMYAGDGPTNDTWDDSVTIYEFLEVK